MQMTVLHVAHTLLAVLDEDVMCAVQSVSVLEADILPRSMLW